jgi:inorganic pyrophosphatase
LLRASVVGGIPMLDGGEADDKILAVLLDDPVYGSIREVAGLPAVVVDRLIHYFSTYKLPRSGDHRVSVGDPYDRSHAEAVITAAMADYREEFSPEP